jgi:hypothetical protein
MVEYGCEGPIGLLMRIYSSVINVPVSDRYLKKGSLENSRKEEVRANCRASNDYPTVLRHGKGQVLTKKDGPVVARK